MKMKKWFSLVAFALASLSPVYQAQATITNQTMQTLTALGNGVTTNYTIGFPFQYNSQIVAYIQSEAAVPYTQTLLVYGAGAGKYTITGGDPGTTVVMGTAPTSSQRVIIRRVSAITQEVDYDEASAFPAADTEKQMDKMIQVILEQEHKINKKVGLNEASTSTTPTIPDALSDRFIIWNHAGTDFALAPTSAQSFGDGYVLRYDTASSTWKPYDLSTATTSLQSQISTKAEQADLQAHIANVSNPHSVTATQVGNGTAQWNANKIQGTTVNAAAIANNKALGYNSGTGQIEYLSLGLAGPGSSTDNACVRWDGTGGATIQNSAACSIDDSGNITANSFIGAVTGNLTGNTTGTHTGAVVGNSSTATALASNPSDCASNTYATTIAASGDLTCASITNASTTAVSTNTASAIVARDGSGNFAAGTISAALTGNASTATALAADPSACSAGQFVTDIAANGTLTCTTPSATNATPPTTQILQPGTTTYNLNYAFTITSGSATAGATYTNNAVTFTVSYTVASKTRVYMSGSGAPAASGTLTKASGTGDATLTFSGFLAPSYLEIVAVGSGGSGSGSGTTTASSNGTDGNDTTFSTFITAAKGVKGTFSGAGGTGGAPTVSSPAIDIDSKTGGAGAGGAAAQTANLYLSGGSGGGTPLASGGPGGGNQTAGGAGVANSGVGGGGGGGNTSASLFFLGSGGGASAYVHAYIPSPSASYACVVGASVSGGGAGNGGGLAGGASGAGIIVVKEFY